MKNILIIGCGLLGSSLLRRISKKKIAKKIFIYEKSKLSIKRKDADSACLSQLIDIIDAKIVRYIIRCLLIDFFFNFFSNNSAFQ